VCGHSSVYFSMDFFLWLMACVLFIDTLVAQRSFCNILLVLCSWSPSILQNYCCLLSRWSTARLSPSSHRSVTVSAASRASFRWRPRSGRRTKPLPRHCALPASWHRHRLGLRAETNDQTSRETRRPQGQHATCYTAFSKSANLLRHPLQQRCQTTTRSVLYVTRWLMGACPYEPDAKT